MIEWAWVCKTEAMILADLITPIIPGAETSETPKLLHNRQAFIWRKIVALYWKLSCVSIIEIFVHVSV